MAKINSNIYNNVGSYMCFSYSDTLQKLIQDKKLAINSPWDKTIVPFKAKNINAKCFIAEGSKLHTALTFTSQYAIYTYTQNETQSYIRGENTVFNNKDTEGKCFWIWSPNAVANSISGYNSCRFITDIQYMDYAHVIYVRIADSFENNTFTNVRVVSLKDYKTLQDKIVLHVYAVPYVAKEKGGVKRYDGYVNITPAGKIKWNFSYSEYSKNWEMDTTPVARPSVNYPTYGIPVIGIFTNRNSMPQSMSIPNVGYNITYGQATATILYGTDLNPIIFDSTAISNPEAQYHTVYAYFTNLSYDNILEYCMKYGVPTCAVASDVNNNNSENMYIPLIKNGDVTGYTNGNDNASNPAINWSNPWENAGYNPKDPNNYTDKIDLTKPALTTTGIFNRTFALTASSIKSLADYLWNADESIFNEIVKGLSLMGGNPIDGLIDLRLYPFDVSAKAGGGSSKSIVVGRTDTKVNGLEINAYNAVLDLGSCTFFPNFGNFLDYEPFTTASLYIPYVGIVPISTADFMGQTISCKMVVDITTGSCTAIVFANEIPIIYKNGNIGVEIPMTGTNSAEYASRIAGGLTSGATDIALGAASKSVGQVVSGVGSIADSALSVNNTMYNTAGSSSPACGLWQPQNCYFIIQRPVPIVPENYGHTVGYACNYQAKIGDCSGYTQTYNVDVSSINAPESEKNAIAGILNSGFYA